jgi:predicted peptidase
MTFYLYVPQGYTPSDSSNLQQRYPLTLILHGGGERADPKKTAAQNRATVLNQEYIDVWGPGWPPGGKSVQASWPGFVVVPQVVGSNRWVNVPANVTSYALATQPTSSLQMAINIVALVQQKYPAVDANRLYITGISMGGFGVWDAIERWPTLFAAAVPVSGAGDPAAASRIAHLPLWDFHGAADTRVPVGGSRTMIQALRAAGGSPCYTEIPGLNHVIWPQVYGLPANTSNPLYPWLFAQQKNGPTPGAPACNQAG